MVSLKQQQQQQQQKPTDILHHIQNAHKQVIDALAITMMSDCPWLAATSRARSN